MKDWKNMKNFDKTNIPFYLILATIISAKHVILATTVTIVIKVAMIIMIDIDKNENNDSNNNNNRINNSNDKNITSNGMNIQQAEEAHV